MLLAVDASVRELWPAYLMYHTVPGEAGIVDNDMYLAAAEFCRLLYQLIDVVAIENVARDR